MLWLLAFCCGQDCKSPMLARGSTVISGLIGTPLRSERANVGNIPHCRAMGHSGVYAERDKIWRIWYFDCPDGSSINLKKGKTAQMSKLQSSYLLDAASCLTYKLRLYKPPPLPPPHPLFLPLSLLGFTLSYMVSCS